MQSRQAGGGRPTTTHAWRRCSGRPRPTNSSEAARVCPRGMKYDPPRKWRHGSGAVEDGRASCEHQMVLTHSRLTSSTVLTHSRLTSAVVAPGPKPRVRANLGPRRLEFSQVLRSTQALFEQCRERAPRHVRGDMESRGVRAIDVAAAIVIMLPVLTTSCSNTHFEDTLLKQHLIPIPQRLSGPSPLPPPVRLDMQLCKRPTMLL